MTVQLFAFKLFFAWHALEVSPAPAGAGTVSAFGIEDDRGVGDGDWSPTAYKEHAGVVLTEAAVAKKIGSNPRALAAAPASVERAGYAAVPTDLPKHTVIIAPAGNLIDAWRFERNGKVVSVRVEGRLHASVNEALTAAAVAGLGIPRQGYGAAGMNLQIEH
jgi:hypothetical protein